MERKLVALVFIALLIGLGGGYSLGIVMYLPQISAMQSDIADIQSFLFQPRAWKEIANFHLSVDDEWASSLFSVYEGPWRINWTEAGTFMSVSGWTGFLVCRLGPYVVEAVDLGPALSGPFTQSKGTHYMHSAPGNYYIIISGIGADGINLTIESYLAPLK